MKPARFRRTWIVAAVAGIALSAVPSTRGQEAVFELSFAGPLSLSPEVPATFDVVMTPRDVLPGRGAWGWSLGILADGLRILDVTSEGTVAGEIMRQTGFFESYNVFPLSDENDAVIGGVVMGGHAGPALALPETVPSTILRVTVVGSVAEGVDSRPAALRFATLPHPLIPNTTVENFVQDLEGTEHEPLLEDAELSVADLAFRRGDTNLDGRINISDSIYVLSYLFLGGDEPPCLDAADFDDSGVLDISDGHGVNVFLFLGSFVPPPPGPYQCATDATADALPCGRTLCP